MVPSLVQFGGFEKTLYKRCRYASCYCRTLCIVDVRLFVGEREAILSIDEYVALVGNAEDVTV